MDKQDPLKQRQLRAMREAQANESRRHDARSKSAKTDAEGRIRHAPLLPDLGATHAPSVPPSGTERPKAARRGRPRLEETAKTLRAQKPWEKMTPPMSRATWFRRQKERDCVRIVE